MELTIVAFMAVPSSISWQESLVTDLVSSKRILEFVLLVQVVIDILGSGGRKNGKKGRNSEQST